MFDEEEEIVYQDDATDDDDIEFEDDGVDLPPEDPEKRILDDLRVQYNAHSPSELRLLRDYRALQKELPEALNFTAEPFEGRIDRWKVFIHSFGDDQNLIADMKRWSATSHKDRIEMAIYFPPDYPNSPPFMHIIEPRFNPGTGFTMDGGSICNDMMTMEAWKPVYDIVSFINGVISVFLSGNPRINFQKPVPYSLQEAIAGHKRAGEIHKWGIKWLPES